MSLTWTNCLGCASALTGVCQLNLGTPGCPLVAPSDCKTLGNSSDVYVWSNHSGNAWPTGCVSEMVAQGEACMGRLGPYTQPACASAGRRPPFSAADAAAVNAAAGNGYLQHANTSQQCFDEGKAKGLPHVAWNYQGASDPREFNCFGMATFCGGDVWAGPWCYFDLAKGTNYAPRCGKENAAAAAFCKLKSDDALASKAGGGASAAAGDAAEIKVPDWGWQPQAFEACIKVNDSSGSAWHNNSRWAFFAVPPGPPPAAGWPIMWDFAVIDFPSQKGATCGLAGAPPPPFNCSALATSALCKSGDGGKAEYECKWKLLECVTSRPPPPPACSTHTSNVTCQRGEPAKYARCLWNCTAAAPSDASCRCADPPIVSPESMGNQCSCFTNTSLPGGGKNFSCYVPPDNRFHPVFGVGCSIDDLAGGLWFQRVKQLLLYNGIAVGVLNPYVFDAWDAYDSQWMHGADPPFFKRLTAEMSSKTGVFGGQLDPSRVAFHGWSGSAQMVSYTFQLAASGQVPGLGVKAGVMMSGGSHACYSTPESGKAHGVCAHCNSSSGGKDRGSPWPMGVVNSSGNFGNFGCSTKLVAEGGTPSCEFCCPSDYTEDWYASHPDAYKTHPAAFMGQTLADSEADSCAGSNYHDTMVKHGAADRSQFMQVPLHRMRCAGIGQKEDKASLASSFVEYCPTRAGMNDGFNSYNHTIGFAEMVMPLTSFLLKHL